MPIMTNGQLLAASQDYCVDPSVSTPTSLSSTVDFLKREINNTVKDIFSLARKYNLQPLPKTTSTVASQIFYHNPPGLTKIETATITMGNLVLPLRIIHSQEEWDRLHIVPITSSYPIAIFPRRDDYGVYPTPASSGATITLVGNYQPFNMSASDYSAGTVQVINNSVTVTGTNATFTSAMIGRFFALTDSDGVITGSQYRIAAVPTSSTLTLESYFEETSGSSLTYVIAETPNVPQEMHEFIPYRAASIYFATRRRDLDQSQRLMNYYYTGDFGNNNRRGGFRSGVLYYLQDLQETGRGNSQITETGGLRTRNIMLGGIWSTIISS